MLVKYFNRDIPKLKKVKIGDWIDLRVNGVTVDGVENMWGHGNKIMYPAYSRVLIHTGIAVKLPEGYEAHVAPRGSTFKNFGLIQVNSVGVIDESYCGNNDQWFVPMYSLESGVLTKYERVAQFRIMKKMEEFGIVEVSELDNPDRGGYGSTGTK